MRRALAWAVLGCLALILLTVYVALWVTAWPDALIITGAGGGGVALPWALGEVFG